MVRQHQQHDKGRQENLVVFRVRVEEPADTAVVLLARHHCYWHCRW